MASSTTPQDVDILQLVPGTEVLLTDVYPAVDVTDSTQNPTGSTKKYSMAQLVDFLQNTLNDFPYRVISDLSFQMEVDTGYIANNAGRITFILPVLFDVGDVFVVANFNGGFLIQQNANQQILFGNVFTSIGIAGTISSTAIGDSISLVGVVANTSLMVIPAPQGNLLPT